MKNSYKKLFTTKSYTVILMLLFLTFKGQATKRYVASDGTGAGTSWADASGDLQVMIDASAAGDSVWVKSGTYKPQAYPTGSTGGSSPREYAFAMKNGVMVFGGFAGTETSFNQRTRLQMLQNPSALDGNIGDQNEFQFKI